MSRKEARLLVSFYMPLRHSAYGRALLHNLIQIAKGVL